MRWCATAILLSLFVLPAGAAEPSFDAKVSEARRNLRAACQAVQRSARSPEVERPALTDLAAREARAAERLWAVLTAEHAGAAPPGYAGDPAWSSRMEDIRLLIERMRREIESEDGRLAFLSCAHACNTIGVLHEANGVRLAVDAMAVLRKKAGTLRNLLAAGATDKALASIPEILEAHNAVLLAPPPKGSTRQDFLDALEELSRSADMLASAGRDDIGLRVASETFASIVERVYELSI